MLANNNKDLFISKGQYIKLFFVIVFLLLKISVKSSYASELLQERPKSYYDSLKNTLNQTEIDSVKIKLYFQTVEKLIKENIDAAAVFVEEGIEFAKEIDNKEATGKLIILKSRVLYNQGKTLKAITLSQEALTYFGTQLYTRETIEIYRQLGEAFERIGNFEDALRSWQKALEIAKRTNDIKGIGRVLSSIATLHTKLNKFDKAINYEKESVEYNERIEDETGIAISMNNIGSNYKSLGNYDSALYYLNKSVVLHNELNDKLGLVYNYATFGEVYQELGRLDSALFFAKKSLETAKEVNAPFDIAYGYNDLGRVLIAMEEYTEAIPVLNKANNMAMEVGASEVQQLAIKNLYTAYAKTGKYDSAFKYINKYVSEKEEFWLQEAHRIEELNKYFYNERQQHEIEKLTLEEKRKSARQRLITFIVVVGIIIALVVLVLTYKNLDEKRRLSSELQSKNEALNSSLNYASRIQRAMLPMQDQFELLIPNSFIFYRPRDIVSGDFYWVHKRKDITYIAVADCTGHGVPGAFMSMIGMEKLKEIIHSNASTPSEILTKLHKGVFQALNQEETHNTDGMDISLCALMHDENNKVKEIQFAGAVNSLYITHEKNNVTEEMFIRGDRVPIGGVLFETNKPYTNHVVDVSKMDSLTIYMYTDGYQDQFGGSKSKKFMSKKFRTMLNEISGLKIDEQLKTLSKRFDSWKGKQDQTDDVLVIGFKV